MFSLLKIHQNIHNSVKCESHQPAFLEICVDGKQMMWRKIQYNIIIDPTTTESADSSFVMSVTELKTKILTAFENEIRVSFLLIVKYHVMNTCTNFKQKIA